MFDFMRKYECKCADLAPSPSVPEPKQPSVPLHSPAFALASSLTDPETRGEWEYTFNASCVGPDYTETYKNESRDITVSTYSWLAGSSLSTPFTLNESEKEIVKDALRTFRDHQEMVRERDALARLLAQGTPTRSAETTGSVGEADGGPVAESDAP